MSMKYIRDYYGVHAKRGDRVQCLFLGKKESGVITGARGASLRVKLDGYKRSMLFHPTWELKYL